MGLYYLADTVISLAIGAFLGYKYGGKIHQDAAALIGVTFKRTAGKLEAFKSKL
jgi:hypothetical protein